MRGVQPRGSSLSRPEGVSHEEGKRRIEKHRHQVVGGLSEKPRQIGRNAARSDETPPDRVLTQPNKLVPRVGHRHQQIFTTPPALPPRRARGSSGKPVNSKLFYKIDEEKEARECPTAS